jgi:hypothetical protein
MHAALFLFVFLVPAQGAATYKLGGPRQVVAVVRDVDDDYEVRVRMLPVTAFDEATNDRLNRLKAEHYAMQGLAKHLSREKNVHFEIVGGRVVASAKDGKAYALTFRVPRKNVVLIRPDAEAPATKPGTVRFAFDTPFFTRKRDLIDTGKQLAGSLLTDLSAAQKKVTKTPESVEAFLFRLAELEERGEKHYKRLRDDVTADRFLLSNERDEALDAVKAQEAAWVKALTAAAKMVAKGDE